VQSQPQIHSKKRIFLSVLLRS